MTAALKCCNALCGPFRPGALSGKPCLLLTVYCLPSTVYHLLSFVYCLPSTGYGLLSTVNCLLSTVYCLLSNVYCLLSTVYGLLSTIHCLLSTVYFTIIVHSSLSTVYRRRNI